MFFFSASSNTATNQLAVWAFSRVANVLPELSETNVNAVNDRLQKLGVRNRDDLQLHVKEEDLTKDNLLDVIQARKLIKSWQKRYDENPAGIFMFFIVQYKIQYFKE